MKKSFFYFFLIIFLYFIFSNVAYSKNEDFDFLDQVESNKCNFDSLEEYKAPKSFTPDFILKNTEYNSCSKIFTSYILFTRGLIKEAQLTLANLLISEENIIIEHPWYKFLFKYSRAYGKYDLGSGGLAWKLQPEELLFNSNKCKEKTQLEIGALYCLSAHNYIREIFFPHPYLFESNECLNDENVCYLDIKDNNLLEDLFLMKYRSKSALINSLKDLSFCISINLDCKALYLEPALYGFDYSNISFYSFECPNDPNINGELKKILSNKKDCVPYYTKRSEALEELYNLSIKENNSFSKAILADYFCFIKNYHDNQNKSYDGNYTSQKLLFESSKDNYRALRHLTNHYRDGTCGFKKNNKKYYNNLEELVKKYDKFNDYMELKKVKFRGIGTPPVAYELYSIALMADLDFHYSAKIKETKIKFQHGRLKEKTYLDQLKILNDEKIFFKENEDFLFNYRSLEILTLAYLKPPLGYKKNYDLGIKFGEKLIKKYKESEKYIFVDENNEGLESYGFVGQFAHIDLNISTDTKKIMVILADIYSGKIESLQSLTNITRAKEYYKLAYLLGNNRAYKEFLSLS